MKIKFWVENYYFQEDNRSHLHRLPHPPSPPKPPAANFVSQGDAHMRTEAQIKFLYYPLPMFFYLICLIIIDVL